MRDRGIEFKVGLLIVVALGLFAGFIFVLGNFSLSSGYALYVDYDFSGNVQPGAPVKVSGIGVGRVEDVAFWGGRTDPASGRRVQVRVELWIEDRARDSIRRDAEFFINTAGVLGEQYIEIVPGRDWQGPAMAPGTVAVGVNPPRTDLLVARLYEVLDVTSEVLRRDHDKIGRLISNSASAIDEVNHLLVANRSSIGEMIVEVGGLAGEARKTLAIANSALEPRMIAQLVRDADAVLITASHAMGSVAPAAQAFLSDATRVTALVTEHRVERTLGAVDTVASTAGQAGTLLANGNGLISDLRAGKGTAGALLMRPDLYADLRELVRDLRRNPWKVFWKE